MKSIDIYLFAVAYLILDIVSILMTFSWKSFGGENSMNTIQKILVFFFSFPSSSILEEDESIILFLILNTCFWTLIYLLLKLVYKQLSSR